MLLACLRSSRRNLVVQLRSGRVGYTFEAFAWEEG